MKLNYFKEDREGFTAWMIINLVTQAREDGQYDQLDELTNKWTDIDLTVQVNGVDISPEHFLKGVESNMHYWAEKKAARAVESVLDGVRDEVEKVEDILRQTEALVKSRLESELGFSFPED